MRSSASVARAAACSAASCAVRVRVRRRPGGTSAGSSARTAPARSRSARTSSGGTARPARSRAACRARARARCGPPGRAQGRRRRRRRARRASRQRCGGSRVVSPPASTAAWKLPERSSMRRARCSARHGGGVILLRERAGDVLDRRRQLLQQRRHRAPRERDRVDRDERGHEQPERAADERVGEAAPVDPVGRRLDGRDEHGGEGSLRHEQRSAAEQHGGGHRERDDEHQLQHADADAGDQQVADRDPQRHADDQLDRAPSAREVRGADRDDRRDRREVRLRMAEHVPRDEPRRPGGERRLRDRQRRGAQILQAAAEEGRRGHATKHRARASRRCVGCRGRGAQMPRAGVEPATFPLGGERSIQLSYRGCAAW